MNFFKTYIKNHKLIFAISFILWLCASFFGIYLAFCAEKHTAENVAGYISSLSSAQKSFGAIFKNGVLTNFKYCLFLGISSSFYILFPATLFLICFKGFSSGFTSMFLIRLFGINGVGASFASIVFPLMLSLMPIFIMFTHCLEHQIGLFKKRKKLSSKERSEMLLHHILKIFIIFVFLCVVSLLEAFLSPICMKLLN
ncbi:MAG: hypothetical protein J6R68_03750 [Clostridia bacterium]|nr:hypothetical protein [Clostridia bacterium]MBO7289590.1 hypothetical protein [Clostridia bacterium]